jgi:hypothetical protein
MAGFWIDIEKVIIMKQNIKKIIGLVVILGMVITSFTGCMEEHYYHTHHYHTRGWYDHRHEAYPAGVEFDIHN